MAGYAADTTELRNFLNNSMMPLADNISGVQVALMNAGVSSSAYPPIVAEMGINNAESHELTLRGVDLLKRTVDGDAGKLTKTTLGYDAAPDAMQAVLSLPATGDGPSGDVVSPVRPAIKTEPRPPGQQHVDARC